MWHQPLLQGTMHPSDDDSWFRLSLEIGSLLQVELCGVLQLAPDFLSHLIFVVFWFKKKKKEPR